MTTTEQDLLSQILSQPQQSDDFRKQLKFHLDNSKVSTEDKIRLWNASFDDGVSSAAFVSHLNATPGLSDIHKNFLYDLRFGKGPQVAGREPPPSTPWQFISPTAQQPSSARFPASINVPPVPSRATLTPPPEVFDQTPTGQKVRFKDPTWVDGELQRAQEVQIAPQKPLAPGTRVDLSEGGAPAPLQPQTLVPPGTPLTPASQQTTRQAKGSTIPTVNAQPEPVQPDLGVPGMVERGNIKNLFNRPILHNADGSYSTTSSMSFEEDGKEVLIPTVVDGKRLTEEEAIAHYDKTGEHLGKFDTAEAADTFAEALHKEQAAKIAFPLPPAVPQSEAEASDMIHKMVSANHLTRGQTLNPVLGAVSAVADTVQSLASPENLAFAGGLGLLGIASEGTSVLVPGIARLASLGVLAHTGYKMVNEGGFQAEAEAQSARQKAQEARAAGNADQADQYDRQAAYFTTMKYILTAGAVMGVDEGLKEQLPTIKSIGNKLTERQGTFKKQAYGDLIDAVSDVLQQHNPDATPQDASDYAAHIVADEVKSRGGFDAIDRRWFTEATKAARNTPPTYTWEADVAEPPTAQPEPAKPTTPLAIDETSTTGSAKLAGDTITPRPASPSPPPEISPAATAPPDEPLPPIESPAPAPTPPPPTPGSLRFTVRPRPDGTFEVVRPNGQVTGTSHVTQEAAEAVAASKNKYIPSAPPTGVASTPPLPKPLPPPVTGPSPEYSAKLFQGRGATRLQVYGQDAIDNGHAQPVFGSAQYFATNEKDASLFGDVTRHNVELQHPFILDSDDKWFKLLRDADARPLNNMDESFYKDPSGIAPASERLQSFLRRQGYDGIVVRLGDQARRLGAMAGTDQVVVFNKPSTSAEPHINVEPALESAVVPAGHARFYHGGSTPSDGGARWVTPDYNYAKGYADKSGSKVYSVDIPKTSELLHKSYDDTGADHPAPYVSFEAPGGLTWRLAKAPEPSVVKPPAVITPPPEASKPEWDEWITPYTTDDGKDREVSGEIYNGQTVYKAPVGRYKGEWVVGKETGLITAGPFPTKKDAKVFVETHPSSVDAAPVESPRTLEKPPTSTAPPVVTSPPKDIQEKIKEALTEELPATKLSAIEERLRAKMKPGTGFSPMEVDDEGDVLAVDEETLDLYANRIKAAPWVGHGHPFVDLQSAYDPAHVELLAQRPYMGALSDVLSAVGVDLLRAIRTARGEAIRPEDRYGIVLGPRILGVNVDGPRRLGHDGNLILVNLYSTLGQVNREVVAGIIKSDTRLAQFAERLHDVILHEATHDDVRVHLRDEDDVDAEPDEFDIEYKQNTDRTRRTFAGAVAKIKGILEANDNAHFNAIRADANELAFHRTREALPQPLGADFAGSRTPLDDQDASDDGAGGGLGSGQDILGSVDQSRSGMAEGAGFQRRAADVTELDSETIDDLVALGAHQFKIDPASEAWTKAMMVSAGDWVAPYLPSLHELIEDIAFVTNAQAPVGPASEPSGGITPPPEAARPPPGDLNGQPEVSTSEGGSGAGALDQPAGGILPPPGLGTTGDASGQPGPPVASGVGSISGEGIESGSGSGVNAGADSSGGVGGGLLAPPPTTEKNAGFFRIDPSHQIGVGSEKVKIEDNLVALRLLKALRTEARLPNEVERGALARYVGWGGLSSAFKRNYGYGAKNDIYDQVLDLLSNRDYEAARRSTINAHFTSPLVTTFLWDIATILGFKGGTFLEPAMGIGNLLGLAPEGILRHTDFVGVELDNITAEIAKYLYPDATIFQRGYESFILPDGTMTLVMSNVPFDASVYDTRYPDLKKIHDYYFIKSLDKTMPGGAVIFITSRFTMDKQASKVREMIADRADLVAAFRLPNDAFKENARTSVTTDVIVLRKRQPGEVRSGPAFQDLKPLTPTLNINEYFIEHPENMLGTMTTTGGMYGPDEPTLDPKGDLAPQLDAAVKRITSRLFQSLTPPPGHQEISMLRSLAPDDVKENAYVIDDEGQIKQRINGVLENPKNNDLRFGDEAKQIRLMIQLRDAVREAILTQMSTDGEEALEPVRERLNKLYDEYQKKHGYLRNLQASDIFSEDPEYARLLALENYDSKTDRVSKAAIFTKRTIEPYRPLTSVSPDPKEGLLQILAERGYPDLARLADLAHRPLEQTIRELVELGLIFKDPESGKYEMADQYLSGKVKDKLAKANAAAMQDSIQTGEHVDRGQYHANVFALEKVQPPPLSIYVSTVGEDLPDINPKLGATWIPPAAIDAFVNSLLRTSDAATTTYVLGTWHLKLTDKARNSIPNTREWAGGGIRADDLIEYALNQKRPKIMIKHSDGTSTLDEARTLAAREAQIKIKGDAKTPGAFERWVRARATTDWATRLENIYNDTFNSTRNRQFDGSHLTLPGKNVAFTLRAHQLDAIMRIINDRNALLAHVVGAGKTYVMIAAGMELKRLGIKKKIMYTVPNALIRSGQWADEFYKLYPGANILIATKEDFSTQNRKQFMARIATGDWDAVLIGHSTFDRLPISPKLMVKTLQQELDELNETLAAIKGSDGKGKSRTVKQLEKAQSSLEAKLKKQSDIPQDDTIHFDELGVDMIFVDEAHKYKNLTFYSKMKNISGLGGGTAGRALLMKSKTDYIHDTYGGGVVFASGTPVSNTIAEVYTMFRFLAPKLLPSVGMRFFDDWAAAFGDVIDVMDLTPDAQSYRSRQKFSDFSNLPELISMFRQFTDVKLAEELDLPVPALKGGKPTIVEAQPTPDFEDLMLEILKRAEVLRAGHVDKKKDNWLTLTGDAKKIALDVRLYDHTLSDHPDSKANRVVDTVYAKWLEHAEAKGTQLVFAENFQNTDRATGKSVFNLFEDMKAKLVKRGVPEDQVYIIQDIDDVPVKRRDDFQAALFRDFNAGKKRIMFGTTARMGEGTNLQERLVALSHLDAPWKPAELQQRDGRIIRQGNRNYAEGKEVEIFQFITVKSFDAYLFQALETKALAISKIMAGRSSRRGSDAAAAVVLNYGMIKARASGNPDVELKTNLEAELHRLTKLEYAFRNEQLDVKSAIDRAHREIGQRENVLQVYRHFENVWKSRSLLGGGFTAVIDGVGFSDYEEAKKYLTEKPGVRPQYEIHGIPVKVTTTTLGKGKDASIRHEMEIAPVRGLYGATDGGPGLITNVETRMAGLPGDIRQEERWIAEAREKIPELERILNERVFTHTDEIRFKEAELAEVNKRLAWKPGQDEEVVTDAEEDEDEDGDSSKSYGLSMEGGPEDSEDDEVSDDVHESRSIADRPSTRNRISPPPDPQPNYGTVLIGEIGEAAGEVLTQITESVDQLKAALVPASRGAEAQLAALVVRTGAAVLAARDAKANEALDTARKYFDRQSIDRQRQFMFAVEDPDGPWMAQLSPDEIKIAAVVRSLLDKTWEEVLKRSTIDTYIEDYFPHIWKDPTRAADLIKLGLYGKRPLLGKKGFLKRRHIITVWEGIELGLDPLYDNPIETVIAQLHQENKYIAGYDMLEELKHVGILQRVLAEARAPAGMVQINDPIGTIYYPPHISVKEAHDDIMVEQLNKFAGSLGIKHLRMAATKGMSGRTWGWASPDGVIHTRFGAPETILTHEIGHQLDYQYHIAEMMVRNKMYAKELRALADLRYEGKEDFVSESYKKYVRQGSEKIANLIHAMIHAPELAEKVAPMSVEMIHNLVKQNPELKPLLDIRPSLVLGTRDQELRVPGLRIMGHWYAPDSAALIINNYLSPGLSGNKLYDLFRYTGNMLNQVQLGLSGYHFLFTAMEAGFSKAIVGVGQVVSGQTVKGLKNIALGQIVTAPWISFFEGSRIQREFYNPGSQGEYYSRVIDDLIKAGGRVKMDSFYMNSSVENFWKAWRTNKTFGVVGHMLPALIEQVAKPLMQVWVPRLKLAVFAEQSRQALEALGPDADPWLVRYTLARVWDSVDNRMGQMVYDNLFWHRVLKDLTVVVVRSPGWSIGSFKHIVGAISDTAKALVGKGDAWTQGTTEQRFFKMDSPLQVGPPSDGNDYQPGSAPAPPQGEQYKRRFRPTDRMYWLWIVMPISVGLYGAIAQYLSTGKLPESPIDLFYWQNGGTNPDGTPSRTSFATYAKDIYAFAHDLPGSAVETVGHKLHPMLSAMLETWENKDFYGTEIRHKDDPQVQQLEEYMKYVAGQYEPFSVRNMQRDLETGEGWQAVGSFIGLTPAPHSVSETRAERLAAEYQQAEIPQGGRTQEAASRSKLKARLVVQLKAAARAGNPSAVTAAIQDANAAMNAAVKNGQLSEEDRGAIYANVTLRPLQRMLKNASLEHMLNVWDIATPKERDEIRALLESKAQLLDNMPGEIRTIVAPRYDQTLKADRERAKLASPPNR